MHGKFCQHEKSEVEFRLDGIAIPKCEQFRYLGVLFQENGMIDENVTHRIEIGWFKWISVIGVLFDRRMHVKVEGSSTQQL